MLRAQGSGSRTWCVGPHTKWGFPEIRGTLFGGPNNKDYSILGSILGSPDFGKVPNRGLKGPKMKDEGVVDFP